MTLRETPDPAIVPSGDHQRGGAQFRWVIVGVLCAVGFVLYIDRINIAVAAPWMKQEYQFSEPMRGIVLGAFLIGYAVGLVPGGWLADRFGPHRVLTAAGTAWGVLTILTGLVPTGSGGIRFDPVLMLIAARFVLGLCEGCTFRRSTAPWPTGCAAAAGAGKRTDPLRGDTRRGVHAPADHLHHWYLGMARIVRDLGTDHVRGGLDLVAHRQGRAVSAQTGLGRRTGGHRRGEGGTAHHPGRRSVVSPYGTVPQRLPPLSQRVVLRPGWIRLHDMVLHVLRRGASCRRDPRGISCTRSITWRWR